jgi:nicotinate-nucleotide pyrophosphorylase (carboxylating)
MPRIDLQLKRAIRQTVASALSEDLGDRGDVTSEATIPQDHYSTAHLISRESGVLCGVEVAAEVFRQRDPSARIVMRVRDGARIHAKQEVLHVHGHTRSILSAERVALNFIQRLSGIATLTSHFVEKVRRQARSHCARVPRILDTRKTTPLMRALEKYAVRCGGGMNHRMGLFDAVLIKDNHLAALHGHHVSPIAEAVARARSHWPKLQVEVECETLDQVKGAVGSRPDMIMLDNMTPRQIRRAVQMIDGRAKIEVSGGVTLRRTGPIARTGVDYISIGALTHSAYSVDFSLDVISDRRAR